MDWCECSRVTMSESVGGNSRGIVEKVGEKTM